MCVYVCVCIPCIMFTHSFHVFSNRSEPHDCHRLSKALQKSHLVGSCPKHAMPELLPQACDAKALQVSHLVGSCPKHAMPERKNWLRVGSCVRACVRARVCVRACVRGCARVRACVRACRRVRVCLCVSLTHLTAARQFRCLDTIPVQFRVMSMQKSAVHSDS